MKTHPNSEEWMSFLYGEASPERSAELDAHLRQCGECQKRVAHWRGTLAALDADRSPAITRSRRSAARISRWAAAAALVLGIGFGAGRLTSSSSAEMARLEMAMRTEMEAKLTASRAELLASIDKRNADLAPNIKSVASEAARLEAEALLVKFARSIDEQRDAERDVFVTALRNIEERRATEFASLRKDLDTLAVNADDGLSRTQEQLMELASMTQPPSN
ncbi:MAG: zf-HC2 domain-containing protein [Verrucomicrobia bacterium]|nr:zf-HC2 domain-containing protein [Verrucomicrobiota bacterium]